MNNNNRAIHSKDSKVNQTIRQVSFNHFIKTLNTKPKFEDCESRGKSKSTSGIRKLVINYLKEQPGTAIDIAKSLGLENKEVYSSAKAMVIKSTPDLEAAFEKHNFESLQVFRITGDDRDYIHINRSATSIRRGDLLKVCKSKLMTAREIHVTLKTTISTVNKDIDFLYKDGLLIKDKTGVGGVKVKAKVKAVQ